MAAGALDAEVQGFAVEGQHSEGVVEEEETAATGWVGGTVAGAGVGAGAGAGSGSGAGSGTAATMGLTAGGGGDEGQVGDDTAAYVEKAHSAVGVGYWYFGLKVHPDSRRADSVGLR